MPLRELARESAYVLFFRPVADADPVVPDLGTSAEQQLGPKRGQIETGADGKRQGAIHTWVEVDQERVFAGADELELEDATPAERLEKSSDRRLELAIARNRDRVGADSAVRR